jgi:hypothetical protein
MRKENISGVSTSSKKKAESSKRPHISPAMRQVVKNNLKELEQQSDKEFLIRAEMERKLSSL